MARYIYLMDQERTISDHYRVLEPGERLGDIDELHQLNGVISAVVAETFAMLLEKKYQNRGMTVHETQSSSWSAVKEQS